MRMWRDAVVMGSLVMGSLGVGCVGAGNSGSDPSTPGSGTADPETVTLLKSFVPPDPNGRDDWSMHEPDSLVTAGDKLYFALNDNDGTHCCALWTSDATPEGTVEVKTFDPKVDANHLVQQLTPVGNQVFFVAQGWNAKGVNTGNDLWVSDGSPSGTRLITQLAQGPVKSPSTRPAHGLVALGKSLLFFQQYPSTATAPEHIELWKSDGTPSGTVRVKDLGSSAIVGPRLVAGNTFYFTSSDPVHGAELWKSDGTDAGTQLVQDLAAGADSSTPSDFRTDGTSLYFTATVNAHPSLWKSEGGTAGAVLVQPLDSDATEAAMKPLALAGQTLYLSAVNKEHSIRLYRMDLGGSGPARRQLVATLPNSGAQDSQSAGDPSLSSVAATGKKLYFAQSIPSGHPAPLDVELWVSNGTEAGTQRLMHPMSLSDEFVATLGVVGDRVVTTGYDDARDGLEPWVSDGTVTGTRELKDIAPGKASSFPRSFTPAGNAMFFIAYDSQHGNSLWVFKPGS